MSMSLLKKNKSMNKKNDKKIKSQTLDRKPSREGGPENSERAVLSAKE